MLWIILILMIIVFFLFIYYFNRFNVLDNRIGNSFSQIDVQLKRRADLIPNLLETVKGYMKHEKSIIQDITKARQSLVSSKGLQERLKADKNLENHLSRVFALAENYPNLKSNENFLELQRELATTEDKIAYSRQYYNDSILAYNDLCKTYPGKFFADLYKKKPKEFFQISEEEKEPVKIKFE